MAHSTTHTHTHTTPFFPFVRLLSFLCGSFFFTLKKKTKNTQKNKNKKFLRTVRADATDKDITALFSRLNKDDDDDELDVKEFVDGVEEISLSRLLRDEVGATSYRPLTWLRVMIFERKFWGQVQVLEPI